MWKWFSVTAIFSFAIWVLATGIMGCISLQEASDIASVFATPTPVPTPVPTATPVPVVPGYVEVDHSTFVVTGNEVVDFCAWWGAECVEDRVVISGLSVDRQKFLHDKWCHEKAGRDMPCMGPSGPMIWGCP